MDAKQKLTLNCLALLKEVMAARRQAGPPSWAVDRDAVHAAAHMDFERELGALIEASQ